jgi:glycerol-3-phosphate O-acyltransferase
MADLSAWDRVLLTVLRGPISLWARPHVLPEDLQSRFGTQTRPVCYVLEMHGVADLVVLEKVAAAHRLPSPSQALKRPLPDSSVFFLDRFADFWGDRIDRRISPSLRQLVRAASVDTTLDVDLIPVSVFWGRAPQHERSWLRLLLAETWDRVGRFRRFLSVLVNGRNLFVQFGEPVSLRALVEEGADPARAVRRVNRTLRALLSRQRAAAIGPDLSHQRTIAAQVLRTAAVRRAMRDEMRAKKISRRQAL